MGIDINIYASGPTTDEQVVAAREFFRAREFDVWWDIRGGIYRDAGYDEDRVTISSGTRYYGPGYERGHWPNIYAMIRAAKACFPDATIHYGGDSSDDCPEADEALLASLWAHYLSPTWDDYHKQEVEAALVPARNEK